MDQFKQEVITFFDQLAPQWDAGMRKNERVIAKILDGALIEKNKSVLDVACGTGVMIPYYLARGASVVIGVDISPKMVQIADGKFQRPDVGIICADVEDENFAMQIEKLEQLHRLPTWNPKSKIQFDRIMVYNAMPHFEQPERLINRLEALLAPEGTLTIAHGRSRASLTSHHQGSASKVSVTLLHEDDLARIMSKNLEVIVKISDDEMYQVTGKRVIRGE